MNRDEALSRAPEMPPELHVEDGVTWLAPHDGEKGGTWMGANANGVVACLLNAYLPGESLLPDKSGRFRSRGEIIPNVLRQGASDKAIAWVENAMNPELYPSFMLLVFSRSISKCYTWHKSGGLKTEELSDEWTLRSSSGWDSHTVTEWREELFEDWLTRGAEMVDHLPKFHLIQDPEREDWSPLMKRSWSATRSVTQIEIDYADGALDLRYWPDPTPDAQHADVHLSVPLIQTHEQPADAELI